MLRMIKMIVKEGDRKGMKTEMRKVRKVKNEDESKEGREVRRS